MPSTHAGECWRMGAIEEKYRCDAFSLNSDVWYAAGFEEACQMCDQNDH